MRRATVLCLTALLTACAPVGPDYVAPKPVLPEAFENAQSELYTSQAPTGEVWRTFDDDGLRHVLDWALAHNTDIGLAVARLDESRALSGLTRYSWFPTVTASSTADRNRLSDADPFAFPGLGTIDIYRLTFDASWEIDLFGSLRRQAQQIRRVVEADTATLHDVQRSIVGEVVQGYFALRGAQARLAVQRANRDNQQRAVEILTRSLEAGRGTALDVARARSLERTLAAAIPGTEADVARAWQSMGVLTARPVAELKEKIGEGALPPIPETINLGEPAQWLQRRPDVRAAERQLAAATAGVGAEVAEYYPKINLIGSFGYAGQKVSAFGDADAQRWNVGPALSWRFLDVGRVKRNVMAAEARERQALATFQGVVLRALEDMENALAGYRATSLSALALREALDESARASELATLRFDNGASNFLEVLDARRTQLELEDQHAQAMTARATALAAVYKALAAN